jgi:hypothetical protein
MDAYATDTTGTGTVVAGQFPPGYCIYTGTEYRSYRVRAKQSWTTFLFFHPGNAMNGTEYVVIYLYIHYRYEYIPGLFYR